MKEKIKTDKVNWEEDFRGCFYLWDKKDDGSYVTCGEDVIDYIKSVVEESYTRGFHEALNKAISIFIKYRNELMTGNVVILELKNLKIK